MIEENKENYEVEVLLSKELPMGDNENARSLEDVMPKLEKWWFQYPHLLKLNLYLGCALFGTVTMGYDAGMMGNLQTLPSWYNYFNQPSGGRLGTLSNGLAIGALCVIPFLIVIGDRIGRKPKLMAGIILTIIGAGIQAGAVNYGMFLASRIILGFGANASQIASGPLLTETSYPSQRPALTSMIQGLYPLGSFLAALFTWGPYMSDMKYDNWSWRLPSLLQAVFPMIQLLLGLFCPESPRWLISKNREDEAFEILTKYHGGGDRSSELVKFEMAEIKAAIAMESIRNKISWGVWFKTKANMHRLFITLVMPSMLQLCGSSLISYYFSIVLDDIGYTDPVEKLKINIGLTVYGGVWGFVFATFAGKLKRRYLLISGFLLMCLTFIVWIVLASINERTNFENKSLGRGIVALVYLFYGFYHQISPIGITYVMEVVPFHLRNKASTLMQFASYAWVFFNNYVNNIGMDAISWRYYIVFCVLLFVHACVVYFFFPETHGLGLEEVAQVFGEDINEIRNAADEAIMNAGGTKQMENVSRQLTNKRINLV